MGQLDTILLPCICYVTNYGNVAYLMLGNATAPIVVTAGDGLSVLILHSFLIHRVYHLSHQILLSMTLGVVALGAFSATILSAVDLATFSLSPEGLARLRTYTIVFATTSAGADILIATTLIIYIHIAQKKVTSFRGSVLARPLKMLSRAAVESGCIPAAWTTIAISLFLWNNHFEIGSSMLSCVGRISALTLLYNLNLKQHTTQAILSSAELGIIITYPSGENPK